MSSALTVGLGERQKVKTVRFIPNTLMEILHRVEVEEKDRDDWRSARSGRRGAVARHWAWEQGVVVQSLPLHHASVRCSTDLFLCNPFSVNRVSLDRGEVGTQSTKDDNGSHERINGRIPWQR